MARFRGTVAGGRSEASRLGHKNTGLRVTANGWNSGVQVAGYVNENDEDVFDIYLSTGSSYSRGGRMLGQVRLMDGRPVFEPAL